jgi:hypothetical protein
MFCSQSSSSTESDSLPFANENAGTIKQRAARPHATLTTVDYQKAGEVSAFCYSVCWCTNYNILFTPTPKAEKFGKGFLYSTCNIRSTDCCVMYLLFCTSICNERCAYLVSVVSRLWVGRLGNSDSIPSRCRDFPLQDLKDSASVL